MPPAAVSVVVPGKQTAVCEATAVIVGIGVTTIVWVAEAVPEAADVTTLTVKVPAVENVTVVTDAFGAEKVGPAGAADQVYPVIAVLVGVTVQVKDFTAPTQTDGVNTNAGV